MGRPKGQKKIAGKDFQKGFDPRRNMNGPPKADVRVAELKAELRGKLIEAMNKYYDMPYNDIAKVLSDPNITMGEATAFRFWQEATRRGDPARVGMIANVIGLQVNKVEHSLSDSLESLVLGSQEKKDET